MKLQEVFELHYEQLHESLIRKAMAAAGFVLAALPASLVSTPDVALTKINYPPPPAKQPDVSKLVSVAAGKYKVDPTMVKTVVLTAMKHSYKDFPTAKDILAVVGVESSFQPGIVSKIKIDPKVSKIKNDPAMGLMQVRPGVWKMKPEDLETIDSQIKTGANILRKYYLHLGSREAALHAYNVGIGNHRSGKATNPRYVPKVDKEKSLYKDI